HGLSRRRGRAGGRAGGPGAGRARGVPGRAGVAAARAARTLSGAGARGGAVPRGRRAGGGDRVGDVRAPPGRRQRDAGAAGAGAARRAAAHLHAESHRLRRRGDCRGGPPQGPGDGLSHRGAGPVAAPLHGTVRAYLARCSSFAISFSISSLKRFSAGSSFGSSSRSSSFPSFKKSFTRSRKRSASSRHVGMVFTSGSPGFLVGRVFMLLLVWMGGVRTREVYGAGWGRGFAGGGSTALTLARRYTYGGGPTPGRGISSNSPRREENHEDAWDQLAGSGRISRLQSPRESKRSTTASSHCRARWPLALRLV